MNFSEFLRPENINEFSKYINEQNKILLRKELEQMILKNKNGDYFDIEIFRKKNDISLETMTEMLSEILGELETLGWKWQLCYGNTGLYIFNENPPSTLW
jgi:hypothetical protein